MTQKKKLKDLNLLDRFLFAEAMEDSEIMRSVLEIILGKDIVLKYLPQVEKEERKSPLYRFVKLDVWAQDTDDTIYDTEVKKKNTGNLPRRSRYYQGIIDSKLLEPGEIDFDKLNNIFIIIIAPFDMFGMGKYKYTFKMSCEEARGLGLEDGAIRIFLNTRGKNSDEVGQELVELLQYMEHTNQLTDDQCESQKVLRIKRRIQDIKSSEEVGVRYMQEWEEREMVKREAHAEGEKSGLEKGITAFIQDNLEKHRTQDQIVEKLIKRFEISRDKAEEFVNKQIVK